MICRGKNVNKLYYKKNAQIDIIMLNYHGQSLVIRQVAYNTKLTMRLFVSSVDAQVWKSRGPHASELRPHPGHALRACA